MEFFKDIFTNIPLLGTIVGSTAITILIVNSLRKTITLALLAFNQIMDKYKKYRIQLERLVSSQEGQQDRYDVLHAIDLFTESLSGLLRLIKAPKSYIKFLRNIVEESDYKKTAKK